MLETLSELAISFLVAPSANMRRAQAIWVSVRARGPPSRWPRCPPGRGSPPPVLAVQRFLGCHDCRDDFLEQGWVDVADLFEHSGINAFGSDLQLRGRGHGGGYHRAIPRLRLVIVPTD